jgi:ADP-ribose pyrophosphatase
MRIEPVTRDDVEIKDKTAVFQGYFRIDRYDLRFRMFGGGWTPVVRREIFERGHAVGLLLYDPARDMVGLCEQFRVGAYAAGWDNPWLIEIPAGIIDAGQTPEAVAIREAREETGIDIHDPRPICRYLVTPGGSSESMQLFIATVDSTLLSGVHGLAEEAEDIRVFAIPTDRALAWIDEGRICNSMTIIALQWLALHRHRL